MTTKLKSFFMTGMGLVLLLGMFAGLASANNEGWVRVVHASPDAPNVDVYVDGAAVLTDVPYKAASDYLALPAGEYSVEVFVAGTNGEGDPVLSATLPVVAGTKVTVAAVNAVASIELLVLNDDLSTTAGQSKVRFVHASPDAPNVDLALAGGDVLVGDAAFKAASGYLEVAPGVYDLEARVAGTTDVALSIPGVDLKANTVYTAFAIGFAGGGTPALEAWLLTDSTPMPAEMPKSGMGGASETTTGYTFWPAALAVAGLAALFALKRRKQAE